VTEALDALADGRLPGRRLLGLDRAQLDALVEQALFAAEHGRLDAARDLLAALAAVEPARPTLPLLLGHIEADRGALDAALAAYAEAARRLGDSDRPELAADIALARAEVELRLGEVEAARPRLAAVLTSGSGAAKARAAALQEGLSS